MKRRSGVVFNTLVNAGTAPLLALGQLLLTTILASRLSLEAFGTWSFMLGFTFMQGYGGILDFGLAVSAVRSISQHRDDRVAADRFRTAFTKAYRLSSIAGLLLVSVSAPFVLSLVGAHFELVDLIVVVSAFAVLIPVDMRFSENLVLLEAAERFPEIRFLQLAGLYSWVLIVFIALSLNTGVAALAVLFLAQSILMSATAVVVTYRTDVRPAKSSVRLRSPEMNSMWAVAKWTSLIQVLSIVQAQMDRTILAVFSGVDEVGLYQIPYKIYALGFLLLQQFPSAVVPVAANLQFQGDRERTSALLRRGTLWTLLLSIPAFVSIGTFARPLIVLWVGERFSSTASTAQLFMVLLVILAMHSVGRTMLAAHGKSRDLLIVFVASVSANLVASILLVKPLGINGVVVGSIIGASVAFVPLLAIESVEFGIRPLRSSMQVFAVSLAVMGWTLLGATLLVVTMGGMPIQWTAVVSTVAVAVWGWCGVLFVPRLRREAASALQSILRSTNGVN